MRLSTKIAYNTIVQAASKIIATVLGLVSIAIITRYLGQFGFGQYTAIITFLSFFGIIADLGLTLVTVQMISRPGADQDKILGNLLALRLVSALIFLGIAPLIVLFFPYDNVIKIGVAITSLSFLFIALNQIFVGLFQKHLRMDKVSIAEVGGRVILVAGIVAAVKLNSGLTGIMIATVIASLISFIIQYIFSRSLARIKLIFDFKVWREIISKSWPLAITIVLNLAYLKTDILLLSIVKRPTDMGIIAEVGLYGAAYKVIDVLITFPFMFAGIILPIMTLAWAEKNRENFNNILQKSFEVMAILAVPLAVGAQFLARDIMILVAGEDFAAAGEILQVLILAASFIFLGNMFAHAVIAINKQKKIIWAYLFVAITSVIGYFIFIPRSGLFGAAWVTIYSEIAIALASFFILWKFTKFIPNLLIIIKSLAASGIMGLSIYGLKALGLSNVILLIVVSVVVYFTSITALGGITKKDLKNLLNK